MGLIKNAYKLSLSDEQIEQIKLGETVKITVNDTIIHISRHFPDEKELKRRATPLQPEVTRVEDVDMEGNVVRVHYRKIACPTCGHAFLHGFTNFCEHCGQAIDVKGVE